MVAVGLYLTQQEDADINVDIQGLGLLVTTN